MFLRWIQKILLLQAIVFVPTNGFQSSRKWQLSAHGRGRAAESLCSPLERNKCFLWMSDGPPEDDSSSPLNRVLSPRIDDPALPLSDAFVAQIIGPSFQVFWLTLQRAPAPSWLKPIFESQLLQYRGALLAPTLIHGAALSCCWLLGSLAARAYEEEAIDPTIGGYQTVLWRIFQAGCFASGVLIFSTQIDLLLEFGRYVQPGESPETDARILSAWIEVLNDIVFEILAIVPMRLYLATQIANNSR